MVHLNRQPGAVSPGASSLRDLHPFRRRVLPIFVAALAAAVLTALLGFQSYRAAREAATERYALQQLSLARSIAAGLEAYFREVQTSLFSAATNPSLVRMTEDCPLVMEQMSLGFVPRTSIRRIDERGILRFIHPSDDWRETLIGTACDEESFFQEARDTAQIVLSDVLINEKGQRRFRIAVPLFDTAENGDAAFRGILAVSFDPGDIAQRFIKSEQAGPAWIMDRNGQVMFHPREDWVGTHPFDSTHNKRFLYVDSTGEDIRSRLLRGKEGTGRLTVPSERKAENGELLVTYAPVLLGGQNWSVVLAAPLDEVARIVRTSGLHWLLLSALIIAILLTGGAFILHRLYRWSHQLEEEVKKRTADLEESVKYLRNLIEYARRPVAVLNPRGEVTVFNRAFEQMSGRSEKEMLGRPLDLLFALETTGQGVSFHEREQTGGKAQTIVRKDGAMRICILDSVPIFAQDDRTLIATIVQGEDITDQKIAEETKKQLESQLLHAQKMEALGTLVAGVAHEINNPINKIMFDIPLLQKIWHDVIDDLGEGNGSCADQKIRRPDRALPPRQPPPSSGRHGNGCQQNRKNGRQSEGFFPQIRQQRERTALSQQGHRQCAETYPTHPRQLFHNVESISQRTSPSR